MRYMLIAAALMLGACAGKPERPEPVVVIQEVKVPIPVPCPLLESIGPEPTYPDSDAAIKSASNVYERVRLLVVGRLMRVKRLSEYGIVKRSCQK